jgi:hypothetical protein
MFKALSSHVFSLRVQMDKLLGHFQGRLCVLVPCPRSGTPTGLPLRIQIKRVYIILQTIVFHACASPLPQVWDFNSSAEKRDSEGGASKRSVLEQVVKMQTYLKDQ